MKLFRTLGICLALAGCSLDVAEASETREQTTTTRQGATTSSSTTDPIVTQVTQAVYDPYEAWSASKGPELLDMTRGEATARARLGCGTESSPDTIDFSLASAFSQVPGFCLQG